MPLTLAEARRRDRARRIGKKISKADAHYRRADDPAKRSCGRCSMYEKPHACTLVSGKIDTTDVCNFFDRK